MKASRFQSTKPTVVCSVICEEIGFVYTHYGISSFTHEDVMLVLKEIRANIFQALGPRKQIVLLADNARTHRAEDVQKLAASPEVNIKFIWNLVARPDIGTLGIERSRYQSSLILDLFILIVWAHAKDLYRKEVDMLKVYNRRYSN